MSLYKQKSSSLIMEQHLAMPTKCNKCEEVFDLSYDFTKETEGEPNIDLKNLCWECRTF